MRYIYNVALIYTVMVSIRFQRLQDDNVCCLLLAASVENSYTNQLVCCTEMKQLKEIHVGHFEIDSMACFGEAKVCDISLYIWKYGTVWQTTNNVSDHYADCKPDYTSHSSSLSGFSLNCAFMYLCLHSSVCGESSAWVLFVIRLKWYVFSMNAWRAEFRLIATSSAIELCNLI